MYRAAYFIGFPLVDERKSRRAKYTRGAHAFHVVLGGPMTARQV